MSSLDFLSAMPPIVGRVSIPPGVQPETVVALLQPQIGPEGTIAHYQIHRSLQGSFELVLHFYVWVTSQQADTLVRWLGNRLDEVRTAFLISQGNVPRFRPCPEHGGGPGSPITSSACTWDGWVHHPSERMMIPSVNPPKGMTRWEWLRSPAF